MLTPGPVIDLLSARELLRFAVPSWEDMLNHLESSGGRLKFRAELSATLTHLGITDYPLIYENPNAIGGILMRAFVAPGEVKAFNTKLEEASPAGRVQILRDQVGELGDLDEMFEFPDTEEKKMRALADFDALDAQTRDEAVRFSQNLLMAVFAQFYEYLSIAVHGEKLSSLVAQAKRGNDLAFGKAVQIDGRILTVIPYFKDRHARASTEDHESFLTMVSRKRASAPYKGKIAHKSLWMTFAFLESCGLLSTVTGEELLDLCNDVGVGKTGPRIEDVKNIQKRLAEYRKFQKRGALSTP